LRRDGEGVDPQIDPAPLGELGQLWPTLTPEARRAILELARAAGCAPQCPEPRCRAAARPSHTAGHCESEAHDGQEEAQAG